MKIMVTGDRGYIGTVLVPMLKKKGHKVVGYDSGYFSENILEEFDDDYTKITKDIRDVSKEDLKDIDGIIHLAGLSNDPLGEFSPSLTEDINYNGTMRLAVLGQETGVSRFVYASSQSMYGISDTSNELDEDDSEKSSNSFCNCKM
jgi:nucleoside-diphosphate-sugar epimerase